jgi:excisionase family DNA binding protein
MEERYLTVPDVCERLHVHEQTVRRWIKTERLPAVLLGRRGGYRILETDLDTWLEHRTETGKAAA